MPSTSNSSTPSCRHCSVAKKWSCPVSTSTSGRKSTRATNYAVDEQTILILEGIHALNPELTPQIPAASKYKIYVSALTTISLDDHNWIPTTDNRLLRRIIRDFNYRGYSARPFHAGPVYVPARTKWIFPYQENAETLCSTPPSCSNSPCSAATQSPSLPSVPTELSGIRRSLPVAEIHQIFHPRAGQGKKFHRHPY